MVHSFFLFISVISQPFQAVGGSLASAGQQVGSLVAATGHLVASVGTRTCALRRGHRVVPEDRQGADNAVASATATRAEASMDDVVAPPVTVKVEEDSGEAGGSGLVSPEDPEAPEASAGADDVSVPIPEPSSEVVPIMVNLDESVVSEAPSSSVGSFKSARSSMSSTASISTLLRSMPARNFVIRSALEVDDSDSDESDSSAASGATLGN